MLAVRFLAAGSILYGVLRLRGAPNPRLAEWRASGLMGVILLNGGLGLVVFAQQWVASSLAAIIVATMPLWLALFVRLLYGERTLRVEILGMLLGVLGVVFLNGESDLRSSPYALLVFLGPVSWAFGSAYSRKLRQPAGPMASAVQMLAASLGFTFLSLVTGETFAAPSTRSLLALLFLIFFGSILAFSAYVYLLAKRVRPALATSYAYVNPLVAVGLGVGFAGESVTRSGYLGMGCIILGVALVVTVKAFRK